MPTSVATQKLIDQAVQDALAAALKNTVATASKPQHINDLRKTWRKSAEHKAAQIKRFVYSLGAILAVQLVGDVQSHQNPLDHFTDVKTTWYYLIPFVYLAWKQAHPSMSASEVDSAPGVTIVPDQVVPHDDPPPPPPPPGDGGDPLSEGDAAP